ncbi:MAG: GntR family transcriptional regulator [Rhodoferax sp.]|nr:GntR family transcriptional regulator [Rhodoferax sp.]
MKIDELQFTVLTQPGAAPLYRLVKRALLRVIESGQCRPGLALPNEADIATAFGVSIGTLRRAVDELVHEHVLVRRQGRGTYVALHNSDRFMFQFFHVEPRPDPRYADVVPKREYPMVECVAFERERASEADATALRIQPGEPVFRIDNRLSLGGRAVVHDRISVAAQMFKGLTEKRLLDRPSTIYNLYQTDFGITVLRAQERTRACVADATMSRLLGVANGMPVLEVHRLALTFGEKPVEFRVSTVNTLHHDYVSVLS